jgi:hypothetical protein
MRRLAEAVTSAVDGVNGIVSDLRRAIEDLEGRMEPLQRCYNMDGPGPWVRQLVARLAREVDELWPGVFRNGDEWRYAAGDHSGVVKAARKALDDLEAARLRDDSAAARKEAARVAAFAWVASGACDDEMERDASADHYERPFWDSQEGAYRIGMGPAAKYFRGPGDALVRWPDGTVQVHPVTYRTQTLRHGEVEERQVPIVSAYVRGQLVTVDLPALAVGDWRPAPVEEQP